jgi:hypothetical protein
MSPEIHYVNLPTKDAQGKDTGMLQIPVFVHPGVLPNDARRAEIAPGHLPWFSTEVLHAEVRERYPMFATLFEEQS